MMFKKFFAIFVVAILGLVITLVLTWPEEFSEKLLPLLMVGGVAAYLFLSWYLGFFLASQKPPLTLLLFIIGALIISFISGYYMGTAK